MEESLSLNFRLFTVKEVGIQKFKNFHYRMTSCLRV